MFSTSKIWASLTGLGLLLSITSGASLAQMSTEPANSSMPTAQLRSVEQPLGLKVGVTLGGVALIGLELWWFLLSKSQSQKTEPSQSDMEVQDSGSSDNQ